MLMCAVILMTPLLSPLKVAFSVTVMSITLGVSLYSWTGSVFPASGVVISFSSGMMILFCYCAMMSNHESKNSGMKKWLPLMVLGVVMSMNLSQQTSSLGKEMATMLSSPLIASSMAIILVTMICVNKSMFSPTKPLASTY